MDVLHLRDRCLIDRLAAHAALNPEKTIYSFLHRGESLQKKVSYAELYSNICSIARHLSSEDLFGERVILLINDSIDFIECFLACMAAGAIPVPLSVPRPNRPYQYLNSIIADAAPRAVIAGEKDIESLQGMIRGSENLVWFTPESLSELEKTELFKPDQHQDIAFIQYTSGSTGTPKGVIVTHRSLMHNQKIIQAGMELDRDSIIMNWLPLYHDMGLIGNMLQPLYLGASCITMNPVSFIQKPFRWLKAISDYRATTTGGPNFAWESCVSRITDEQVAELDLSCLKVAFTGAEPVRAETLQAFSDKFEKAGFNNAAFFPCYGMAESTLYITGCNAKNNPTIKNFSKAYLKQNRVLELDEYEAGGIQLVGCGVPCSEMEVQIVNRDTQINVADGFIGEIWIRSESVTAGYYHKEKLTEESYQANLVGKYGFYFRTGDLGFIHQGELYISGRCKDLILIRGKNYYPQDIEHSIYQLNSQVVADGSAAVSVDIDDTEHLIIISEAKKDVFKEDLQDSLVESIRECVVQQHEIVPSLVVILRPGELPKTTSGKVKRAECQRKVIDYEFNITASEAKRAPWYKALSIEVSQ